MWICTRDKQPDPKDRIIICNSDGRCTVAKWDPHIRGWNWEFGANRLKLALNFMWWMKAPETPFMIGET